MSYLELGNKIEKDMAMLKAFEPRLKGVKRKKVLASFLKRLDACLDLKLAMAIYSEARIMDEAMDYILKEA